MTGNDLSLNTHTGFNCNTHITSSEEWLKTTLIDFDWFLFSKCNTSQLRLCLCVYVFRRVTLCCQKKCDGWAARGLRPVTVVTPALCGTCSMSSQCRLKKLMILVLIASRCYLVHIVNNVHSEVTYNSYYGISQTEKAISLDIIRWIISCGIWNYSLLVSLTLWHYTFLLHKKVDF